VNDLRLPALGWRAAVVVELVIAAGVAVFSYQVAFRYLTQLDYQTLIDWELRPAVMVACGHGFVEPGGLSPARDAFVQRKSRSISCADFAWGGAPSPAQAIASANRYSIVGAGLAMRWHGVSWETLDAYLASLFAASMAAIYGIFRTATGRVLAIAGVTAVAYSTTLTEIMAMRDFVKLPCFAVLWLALAWTTRRALTGRVSMIPPMIIAGVLTGLGIGLRIDALVFLPVFPAIVLLVAPGFALQDLRTKALAAAVFLAAFAITGVPILRSISGGSNSAHVMVLGMMQQFDAGLGIQSAPYDIGATYSDGFGYTVIASHGLLAQGQRLPIPYASAEYDRIGSRLLATLARQFPADFFARAIGATLQILRYPFDAGIRRRVERLPIFHESRLVALQSRVLTLFAGREWPITLAVLILASAFNWRVGALGAVLILYFCGYSMLQFSRRHVFHLDVIPVFIAILAVHLPLALGWRFVQAASDNRPALLAALRTHGRECAIGVAVLAVTVAAGAGALRAARWWQQDQVAALVDQTIAAAWTEIAVRDEPLAPAILEGNQPTAPWASLYAGDPGTWKAATLMRVPGVVPAGSEGDAVPDLRQQYFMLVMNGRCGAAEVTVVPTYIAAMHSLDHEYIRAFTTPVAASGASRLLVPAYYHLGPNWNRLDGFAVPAPQRPCVSGVFRAADPSRLPMPVMAFALRPDWRQHPLYQQIMTRPVMTMIGTPVE
jgi:hypothetical protein